MRRSIDLNKLIDKEKEENEKLFSGLSKSGIEYSTIEKILMSKMTKYSILDEIVPNIDAEVINIAIDINNLINTLYNPNNMDANIAFVERRVNVTMLSSYLLNIIGHYKNFFITRRKKAVQVFMYYSFNDNFNNGIKVTMLEKYSALSLESLNKYIKDELEIVRDIIKFVPNSYIINTNNMSSDLIPMLIESDNNGNEHTIIVTNNKLAAINMSFTDNVSILDVKGIDSCFYTNENINEFFGVKVNDVDLFRTNLYKYCAIAGFSKYDIPKVVKSTANKILSILDDVNLYEEFYSKNKDSINKNLNFLDFAKRIDNLSTVEKNANYYAHLVDLQLDDINSINSEFFNKFPVNTDFLFKI